MSTGQWDDPEYPYLPRYRAASQPFAQPRSSSFPWKTILRWVTRAVVATGALVLILLVVLSGVLSQAGSRAWSLAHLEEQGATLTYWHETPYNEDVLSREWRDTLGDHWWSEVRAVDYSGPIAFWQSFGQPSESELRDVVAACGKLQRLKSLHIVSDHFSCDQMANWSSLAQLENLDIESSGLTDADLAIIGKMTSLKTLTITRGKVTSQGLRHLANLLQLESLSLDRVEFNVSGSQATMSLPALENLNVSNSPTLDDNFIIGLGNLPRLKHLVSLDVPLGDRGLLHALQGGQLETIRIRGGTITDDAVAEIAKQPTLEMVQLYNMPLTDASLSALEGKELHSLFLDGTAVSDKSFRSLAKISGLQILVLDDCKITGAGLAYFEGPPYPRNLSLAGTPLTPEGISLVAKLPCTVLTLARTSLTDEQLMLFADRDELQNLDVTETQVTAAGVKAFYEARKRRLKQAGQEESLYLTSDYPDETEPYYSPWGRSDFSIDSEMFSVEP